MSRVELAEVLVADVAMVVGAGLGLALLTLRGGSLDCTHAAMVVGVARLALLTLRGGSLDPPLRQGPALGAKLRRTLLQTLQCSRSQPKTWSRRTT